MCILGKSFFSSGRDPARLAVVQFLRKLHDADTLGILDPELAAAQFIGLINESILWPRVVGGGKSLSKGRRRHVVEQAVQTFLCRYRR